MFTINITPYQLCCIVTLVVVHCNLIAGHHHPDHHHKNHDNRIGNHATVEKQTNGHSPTVNQNVHLAGLDKDMKHPLGKDDFDRAKNLDQSHFAVNDKVLYGGKLFEGDIVDDLLSGMAAEKNAISNPNSHWPNGRVPYVISSDFSNEDRSVIAHAINEYHAKTCIRFEPYTGSESNYIYIVRGAGCSSRVGLAGGMQEVTLGHGCVTVGIVEHELMHALGFVHEQSRTDRDSYIRINYQNIRRGLEQNFRKYSVNEITSLNEPYDYGSVLHYGPTAFSSNGSPTIEVLQHGTQIGQRNGFSETDLAKINKLYRCHGYQKKPSHGPNHGSGHGSSVQIDRPGRQVRYIFRPTFGGDSNYQTFVHRVFGYNFNPSEEKEGQQSYQPNGGENRPGYDGNQEYGSSSGSSQQIGGRPNSEFNENGSESKYSPTKGPSSGYKDHSTSYNTQRPSNRPDYGTNSYNGNNRPGQSYSSSSSSSGKDTFGLFGSGNLPSPFGSQLPGSSITDPFRSLRGNNNNNYDGKDANQGNNKESTFRSSLVPFVSRYQDRSDKQKPNY